MKQICKKQWVADQKSVVQIVHVCTREKDHGGWCRCLCFAMKPKKWKLEVCDRWRVHAVNLNPDQFEPNGPVDFGNK